MSFASPERVKVSMSTACVVIRRERGKGMAALKSERLVRVRLKGVPGGCTGST